VLFHTCGTKPIQKGHFSRPWWKANYLPYQRFYAYCHRYNGKCFLFAVHPAQQLDSQVMWQESTGEFQETSEAHIDMSRVANVEKKIRGMLSEGREFQLFKISTQNTLSQDLAHIGRIENKTATSHEYTVYV
jgi:hypothetical protein